MRFVTSQSDNLVAHMTIQNKLRANLMCTSEHCYGSHNSRWILLLAADSATKNKKSF